MSTIDGEDDSPKEKPAKFDFLENKGLFINVAVILLLLVVVGIFYFGDFDFSSDDTQRQIVLVGDLSSFQKNFTGDLSVETGEYNLKVPTGNFQGNSQTFNLNGFNGSIYFSNKTFYFTGNVNSIIYGKNTLNVNNEKFDLVVTKKTKLDTTFQNLNLNVPEGRIKLGEELNYEIKKADINFENINFSLTYDGTFSLISTVDAFTLNNQNPNIQIVYINE